MLLHPTAEESMLRSDTPMLRLSFEKRRFLSRGNFRTLNFFSIRDILRRNPTRRNCLSQPRQIVFRLLGSSMSGVCVCVCKSNSYSFIPDSYINIPSSCDHAFAIRSQASLRNTPTHINRSRVHPANMHACTHARTHKQLNKQINARSHTFLFGCIRQYATKTE